MPEISRAILNITEKNLLQDSPLTKMPVCDNDADFFKSRRLSLRSFWDLFVITGAVDILCLLLFCVFFLYNYWRVLRTATSTGLIWNRIAPLVKYFDQKDNGSH